MLAFDHLYGCVGGLTKRTEDSHSNNNGSCDSTPHTDGIQTGDDVLLCHTLYAIASKLNRKDTASFHWAFCLDVTNAPDPSKISGLLYDVQGVFGVPATYHYQERLQLGPLAEAPDFVAAVCIGEVDVDHRRALSQVLERVPILRTAGQDGRMWFERALEVLVQKGFCMPEMCAEWVYGQVLEAATEKGMPSDALPSYVRIVRCHLGFLELLLFSLSPYRHVSGCSFHRTPIRSDKTSSASVRMLTLPACM